MEDKTIYKPTIRRRRRRRRRGWKVKEISREEGKCKKRKEKGECVWKVVSRMARRMGRKKIKKIDTPNPSKRVKYIKRRIHLKLKVSAWK